MQSKNFYQAYQKMGGQTIEDKRFKDPKWKELPLFNYYHQSYLQIVNQTLNWVEQTSLDPKTTKQMHFLTKQYLDALSPSNFIFTNPEVLEQTIASQGENIRQGMQNWLNDMAANPNGYWQIQMTDMKAFALGENIAVSKGKIIFQNRMMQLIQYEPTTDAVFDKPLLIIPPWINKYYILDLTEKKSLVKWLVDQGHTVFMISWVNPDSSYRDIGFENYLTEGVLASIEAIMKETKQSSINALGFCIGGTLLAVATAYLKAINEPLIQSATFLTTLIDFSEPGDMGVFIDENQVKAIEQAMALNGYLDGRTMMSAFNLLRSNDLQWSYYVNNYLCGKKPFPFDLLYWNCDPSNLPANMHSFYLRNFYLENRLCVPNGLNILGKSLELEKVNIPCYFLSTAQDHIAPWQSTFAGAQCFSGPVTFVLGGSGHIAGIVNPPSQKKYGYQLSDMDIKNCIDPNQWLKRATSHEGSWWTHWSEWLKSQVKIKVNKRVPGMGGLKIIQEAPGDYVRKRIH
jgi:polyhydroxyalkanoate synthase